MNYPNFSFITLTSFGFGDIYPQHDSIRLLVGFLNDKTILYGSCSGNYHSKFTNSLK